MVLFNLLSDPNEKRIKNNIENINGFLSKGAEKPEPLLKGDSNYKKLCRGEKLRNLVSIWLLYQCFLRQESHIIERFCDIHSHSAWLR